ncbi:MAG TPA: serine hydrolase [Candidatus Acidoferrales bacterium]|nr:serine hydrolase [Candidatus Acidoferrales bacterium]
MNKPVGLCAIALFLATTAAAQQRAATRKPVALLQQNIERIANGLHADWGIYIRSLDTGEEVAIDADKPMETMSVIKVPILVTAFRQIDAGKLSLGQPITLEASDKRFGTGVLRTLHDGLNLTLEDAITLMIIQSDNTATDMMYAKVGGPATVTQTMRNMGFHTITSVRTSFEWFRAFAASSDLSYANITPAELFERGNPPSRPGDSARFNAEGKAPFGLSSAREMGELLEKIARGEAASPASCQQMVRILRLQQMRTRIPKYITGAAIGHKTGDWPPFVANDVGIIQSPEANFVIAIFDNHYQGSYDELEDAVARIAQQAWLYFSYRGAGASGGRAGASGFR